MTAINVCRSCARASLRGTRKLLTAKEKRRNVAKKNNIGHAIDVRTSAVICRERVASLADFAMLVLSAQGRESEAGPKFCVAVERARDRARAAAQRVELFRDSGQTRLSLGLVRVRRGWASGVPFRRRCGADPPRDWSDTVKAGKKR